MADFTVFSGWLRICNRCLRIGARGQRYSSNTISCLKAQDPKTGVIDVTSVPSRNFSTPTKMFGEISKLEEWGETCFEEAHFVNA